MFNLIEAIRWNIKSYSKANLQVAQVTAPGLTEQRLIYFDQITDQAKVMIAGGYCVCAAQ